MIEFYEKESWWSQKEKIIFLNFISNKVLIFNGDENLEVWVKYSEL